MRLRAELRASRWSWATIALLIGLIGGVSIAAAAGAHRTDTAYPRLLRSAHAADVLISPTGTGLTGFYDKVAQLPEVDALVPLAGLNLFTADSQARGIVGLGSPDPRLATSIERLKITSGRLYDPTRAEEAVADRTMARALHLQVGQTLELKVPASSEDEPDLEHARRVQVRIVGVGVTRDNVVPVNSLARESTLLVSPAFIRQFDASYLGFDGALVRLRPGASVATLRTEVDALAPQFPDTRGEIFFANQHVQAATVQRAIRPQAATPRCSACSPRWPGSSSSARSRPASSRSVPTRTTRCGRWATGGRSSSPSACSRLRPWPRPARSSPPRSRSRHLGSPRSGTPESPSRIQVSPPTGPSSASARW